MTWGVGGPPRAKPRQVTELEAGRGIRWVRSFAIPRRLVVVTCGLVPVGIAVALTPCGAWDRQGREGQHCSVCCYHTTIDTGTRA